MIRNPIDVATRVSPNLSALIEARLNEADIDQPVTLATIRDFLVGLLPTAFVEAEHLHHFDVSESLLDELDALIEEFGESALAIDFVQDIASEPLSRVIETVMYDPNRQAPPTLGAVKEAINSGLLARLVGEGVLDEDEDDALLAEIGMLIAHYGEEVLAENFLRYE